MFQDKLFTPHIGSWARCGLSTDLQSTFEISLDDLVLRGKDLESDRVQYNVSSTEHYWPYFGTKVCHPGYEAPDCTKKMSPGNPYWADECPNLERSDTFRLNDQFVDTTKGRLMEKWTPG